MVVTRLRQSRPPPTVVARSRSTGTLQHQHTVSFCSSPTLPHDDDASFDDDIHNATELLQTPKRHVISGRTRKIASVTPSPSRSLSLSSSEENTHKRARSKTTTTIKTKKRNIAAVAAATSTTTTIDAATTTPDSPITLTRSTIAAVNPDQPYLDLNIPPAELRPSATLTTGQSFVWKAIENDQTMGTRKDDGPDSIHNSSPTSSSSSSVSPSAWGSHNATEWVGILRISSQLSIVLAIRETPTTTLYRPLTPLTALTDDTTDFDMADLETYLRRYFQLDESLADLYAAWSKADTRLATIAQCIPGVRILDQDPWECLVSFICSSNNNIPRITKMLAAIRQHYGQPLLTIAGQTLYSFPSVDDLLANATDQELREVCGLGYRSKYILETLRILKDQGGETYLQTLRDIQDPIQVQSKLCEYCGVGRKVADCVALFSLQQDMAIPVDVHVWNIARRDYDADGALAKIKSLTPTTYQQVGDVFRSRFPDKAGWAHSLLFVAELPSFRPVLPMHILKEMDEFRKEEQQRKRESKQRKQKAKAKKSD